MAEDQQEDQELTDDEIADLEDSLDDTGDEEEPAKAAGLKGILSNKKLLMIFGGGGIILILAIGAGIYFSNSKTEERAPLKEEKVDEIIEEEKEEEKEAIEFEKVNIYKLDPFFVPILKNGKETGKFI